ncbi:MAG: AraC family transcriptional regulator, partial [Bacteroidota bacterium]
FDRATEESSTYFLSNDQLLIQTFTRLYDLQFLDRTASKPWVEDLIMKEMLFRLFSTEALLLLKTTFERSIEDDSIRKVVRYIRNNIDQKLTAAELSQIAGMGQTTFFKMFKKCSGKSPVDFILHERIRQAKIMIQKGRMNLQEIAYKSGFNSYEYFCSSFKKIEGRKPTEFKQEKLRLFRPGLNSSYPRFANT